MDDIFALPFENRYVITSNTSLYIACLLPTGAKTLLKADNRFYRSELCFRNTLVTDRSNVIQYWSGHTELPEQVTILVLFRDPIDDLVFDAIKDLEHLGRYLVFAERNRCDLSLLQNDIAFDGPIENLKRQGIALWRENKILLTNICNYDFRKMHFNVDMGAPVAPAAPYNLQDAVKHNAFKKYFRRVQFAAVPQTVYEDFISQDTFNSIIYCLTELNMSETVRNLLKATLLSIKYCHAALKCPALASTIKTYQDVGIAMIYAMRIMYLEEKSTYTDTNWTSRFLIPLSQSEGLPTFGLFNYDNPYFLTVGFRHRVGQQLLIPALWTGQRGLYTPSEAQERLSKYTGNIFKNMKWTYTTKQNVKVRIALCGSAIPAIFIRNPLEAGGSIDYFQEYYPAAAAATANVKPKKVEQLSVASHPDDEDADDNEQSNRLFILEPDSDEEGGGINNNNNAPIGQPRRRWGMHRAMRRAEAKLPSKNDDEFGDLDDIQFDTEQTKQQQQEDDGDKFFTPQENFYNKFTDIDLAIETTDLEIFDEVCEMILKDIQTVNSNVYMKMIPTENKYKHRIYGLPRTIELFSVNSIPGVVSKFHVAAVRAFYSASSEPDNAEPELYMFPTFVTAAMTGVCHDLRWTSCNKDLRDIVLKYYQRGFAFFLNAEETQNIVRFINSSPPGKWPHLIEPANHGTWDHTIWRSKMLYFDYQSDFWNPSVSRLGIYYKLPSRFRCGITRPQMDQNSHRRYGGIDKKITTSKTRATRLLHIQGPESIDWSMKIYE